jgi:hypothetical protein
VFQEYCEDLDIQICYASVAHPESNGQVKRANAEILRGLKMSTYDCFKKHGAKWIDELSCMQWGNQTSPSCATGETPFFLVYGAEAVLPPEITMDSPVSRHMTKPHRTSSCVMTSTSLTSEDGKQLSKMRGAVRSSSAITSYSCLADSSRWTTWCSNTYSPVTTRTNFPPTGRVPSG